MDTREAIRAAMDLSTMVFQGYLSDLEDADLLIDQPKDAITWHGKSAI